MTHISCPTRGHYGKPVQMKELHNEPGDNNYKYPCQHPNHWQWGNGTRNGQKLYYPANEMYIQKWEMTEKEMDDAIKAYDMFSLDMRPRIICKDCAETINKSLKIK